MAAGQVRAHLVIHGRVQGVFYRESTRELAARLGLRGWVRNLPDGSVEAAAQGPRTAVEALVAFCRSGPPHARVDRLDLRWEAPVLEEGPFTVRRP